MAGRALRIVLTVLLIAVAACSNADGEIETDRPDPSVKPEVVQRPATTDCAEGTVGAAEGAPTGVEPEPPEGAGEGDEEEADKGLDEGEFPTLYRDPNAVTPNGSDLISTVDQPEGAEGSPEGVFSHRYDLHPARARGTLEPDLAVSGDRLFLTYNSNAGISLNGASSGSGTQFLNPASLFPRPGADLCCDQRVLRIDHLDMWVWLLQYREADDGSNVIRLASTVGDADLARSSFHYVDWRAEDLGLPADTFLDQAKLAATNEHFIISVNAFGDGDPRTVLIRGSLADLSSRNGTVKSRCLLPTKRVNGKLYSVFGAYPVRGATDTMYIGAHLTQAELIVLRWRDADPSPEAFTVAPKTAANEPIGYNRAPPDTGHSCPRVGASALSDWCRRLDSDRQRYANDNRMTSAWISGERMGFAWNVAQDVPNGIQYPFVEVVEIDATRLEDCAGGACVLGDLGGVVLAGGGNDVLSCKAVVRDSATAAGDDWSFTQVAASSDDLPPDQDWVEEQHAYTKTYARVGDYLGVTTAADGLTWIGSCMTWSAATAEFAAGYRLHIARFGRGVNDPSG